MNTWMPVLPVIITDSNNIYPAPIINIFSVPPNAVTHLQNISVTYWVHNILNKIIQKGIITD